MFRNCLVLSTLMGASQVCYADGRVPVEYESFGGHTTALGQGGVVAATDVSSTQTNPAMLSIERNYTLSMGYHWPGFGREFYQAGVVDSRTNKIAAGLVYTSSQEDYLRSDDSRFLELDGDEKKSALLDSPVKKRVNVGMAKSLGRVSVGLSGQMVEARNLDVSQSSSKFVKGNTLAVGLAGLLTSSLRFGVSAQNLNNAAVADYAPRMYRAGIAWTSQGGQITGHADYRHRERVVMERDSWLQIDDPFSELADSDLDLNSPEQLVTLSASAKVYDVLRLMGSYGKALGQEPRQSAFGGVAIVNQAFTLSYSIGKPYLRDSQTQQSVNLSLGVSI